MSRLAPAAMAAGLLAFIAMCTTCLSAAEPPGPSGAAARLPADVAIEWKDSAGATYEAAKTLWLKELEPLAADPARHDEPLGRRLLKLARALAERFPAEGEKRASVYARLARDLAALRPEDRAWSCLRQLVDESPGEIGLATQALDVIVGRLLEGNRLETSGDSSHMGEYAAERLIALQEAGHLSADHPAVERAWTLRLALAIADGRYWDARQALDRLVTITGRNAWWREREAELYLAAGRLDIAARLFEGVGGRGESRFRYMNKVPDLAPDFPRDLGIEMKWAAVHSRTSGADTAAVQALLDESAEGQGVMLWEEGRHASVWTIVDRLLAAQKPEVLAPLRAAEERQAADLLDRARRTGDPQAMHVLSRRFPWAASVHEAMVASGEQLLRRGCIGQACRVFEDVLAHAEPGEARAKAQVGLWLALASETRDPQTLEAAWAGVAPDATFPWMGGRLPAAEIRRRLLAGPGLAAGAAPALGSLTPELVRIPATCPWDLAVFGRLPETMLRTFPSPLGSLQTDGRDVLVAGPNLLACFGDDVSRPLWWRKPNDVERSRRRMREREGMKGDRQEFAPAPGLFRPAMADGRVYSRWGAEASGQILRGVAAFDAATGEIAWSTDDDPAWEEMWPVSDPVAADGRLYVLTIQDRFGPILPIYLTCLEAAGGRLLWQRTLGSQNPGLVTADGSPYRRDRASEIVRYGNAVTVQRGAVYAITNLGFVARCDARDGMVEWINTYPRVRVGYRVPAVQRRMGSPPLVTGDRVVCLPRDYAGLFALDRATGRLAWDAPLAPSEEAVGLAGGTVIVKGENHLLAIDAAGGRVVWDRRLAEETCGRVLLAGGSLYVGTAETLGRLDAGTGGRLEEKAWPAGDPPREFAVRGGRVLTLSDASAGVERPGPAPAPAESAPLALPLKQAWWLARPDADLWVPPPEAKMPDKVYLASRGVLECIEMSLGGGPVWQRFMAEAPDEVLWAERLMILLTGRRLTALDAATGAVRWRAEAPWSARLKKVCPPYLVLAARQNDQPPQQELAVFDLATGRLLWSRPVGGPYGCFRFHDVAWDGRNFRCFGLGWEPGQPCAVEATVRPSDGETVAARPLLPDPMDRPIKIVVGDGVGFCLTETRTLYEFSLADGKVVRRPTDLKELTDRDRTEMQMIGPWLQISRRSPFPAFRQWILRRGDPAYELRLEQESTIWGGAVYAQSSGTLTATDLETKKTTSYETPAVSEPVDFRGVVDFHVAKDRVWLLSVQGTGRDGGPAAMRVDAFDRATGAPLQSQVLPSVFPGARFYGWRRERGAREEDVPVPSQVVWTAGAIYVTDPRGFHALAPAPPGENVDGYRYVAAMPSRPLAIDGALGDWDESAGVPLDGPRERQGRLYLAHDAANLYLAVRYRDRDFLPRVGAGDAAGGDWLEVGLTTNKESRRWTLALGPRGKAVWEGLGEMPLPKGLAGAVRHDPAAGELVYEMAIPWGEMVQSGADAAKMGLSVAVWDEAPGSGGPSRVLTCGEGLIWRRLLPAAHQPIYLYPLTWKAAEAQRAIVDEAPELPESFDTFLEWCAIRTESPAALLDLYGDFMRRHPQSMTAPRLLAFDRAVRLRRAESPAPALLALARRAGVDEAVCRRYEKQSQAYLSQWIYVDPGGYPRSILVELDDGVVAGPAGWNHRVYWGKAYWAWSAPRPGAQLSERFPQGKWYEMRVPLSLFGMSDLPICGISFSQQGEPRVVWDRSAVVCGAREEVFLEDALPEAGRGGGTWEWLDTPVHSGSKAHAHATPERRYDITSHYVTDFKKPVTVHVGAPPDGPYLSQWVYLDPANRPKALSLGLHDERAWRGHAIWGDKTGHGRYMGPLPAGSGWQELRLPLAWTPLAAEPIAGIFFGQDGGHVVWDKTALVAGGRERVIIDGAAPPAPPGERSPEWAPWVDGHFGGLTPVPGKVGTGLGIDGWSSYVEAPDSPALEPEEMTIEAWICPSSYASGGDLRRWIVCKNGTDETEGHYGLLLNGSGVGAILNIGGTKANVFQASSEQDLVELRRWRHAAMTYDGRDLKVYLDGKPVGSTAVNRKRAAGSTALTIGRRQDTYGHFVGAVDEVRFYRRALSEAEMRARFEVGGGPPAPDAAAALVAHWGFDDEIVSADPAAWQWVDQPSHGAKRGHVQAPAKSLAAHGCLFKEPILDHLPFDRGRVTAALGRHVPDFGPSGQAWQLFGRMLGLEPAAEKRADLCAWFVKAIPDHPRAAEAVRLLTDAYEELRRADPKLDTEARFLGLNLPPNVLYAYHRKYDYTGRWHASDWQVLGPLPNPEGRGHDTAYPPETEGVKLGVDYEVAGGKMRWAPYQSQAAYIDMRSLFGATDHALAYAACWVRSETAQPAILEFARNDACKVWINRQLVVDAKGESDLWGTPTPFRVDLKAGWNEVLVKVERQRGSGWAFILDIVAPSGRGQPMGTETTFTPPPAAP